MTRVTACAALALVLATAAGAAPASGPAGGEELTAAAAWSTSGSPGVVATVAATHGPAGGEALRLAFDFQGHGGWAVVRRAWPIDLPANYEIRFWARLEGGGNDLEVKLLDPGGENVWWRRYPAAAADSPSGEWRELVIPKRRVEFAWGPRGGGVLERLGAIELAVVARAGGRGTLEIAGLRLDPLAPPPPWPPRVRATASAGEESAPLAVDGQAATAWRAPAPRADLVLDLGARFDFGGLVLDWMGPDFATDYAVDVQDDAAGPWRSLREVSGGNGGRDWLALPETTARRVRLRLLRSASGHGFALAEAAVRPLEFAATRNAFLAAVAADLPRGAFPRPWPGEQGYWTIAARDGDGLQALLSEDGAIEPWAGGPSIEPFLRVDGKLWTWADVETEPSLAEGDLPIPSLRWRGAPVELVVTALADGPPPQLRARYVVRNTAAVAHEVELLLGLRPLQVNPPTQFLNRPGGAAEIERIVPDRDVVRLEPGGGLRPIPWPDRVAATAFDGGEIGERLTRGELPAAPSAADAQRLASGVLAYRWQLAPGEERDVELVAALGGGPAPRPAAAFDRRLQAVSAGWRAALGTARFTLPGDGQRLARLATTALGHILELRAGAALHPGARSYARSWIRDGALMSAALLRFGRADAARDYLRWYATYLLPDGRVPCCVDERGADPVPENDSDGELLYLAGEYLRLTGDVATVRSLWPRLRRAAEHIDRLRAERRTAEYRSGAKRAFFGLLPESISHEGYSAHPEHSLWDDFWAVRGLKDAVELARALGETADAQRFARSRDELRADVRAAIERVIAERHIDYLPGSVELADFDPTSSTVALDPAGEEADLPELALRRTFARYLAEARARFAGPAPYLYTPYELRIVGALVRLGERSAAIEMLRHFVADLRPDGWNQWPEVVWSDRRTPRFLGDLPHAWVESDFLRAFTDLFAYRRELDETLVVAAGIPAEWLQNGGVAVEGLATAYGTLRYSLRAEAGVVRYRLGAGLRVPAGGLLLAGPRPPGRARATLCGRPVELGAQEELRVRSLPCEVAIEVSPTVGVGEAQ